MKKIFAIMICSTMCTLTSAAFAQSEASGSVKEAKPVTGGDVRAPSPVMFDKDRMGFFQVGVGPAIGAGFHSDSFMYNVMGSYNLNLSERFTAKVLADLYFGTGTVSSRLLNYGVAGDLYLPEINLFRNGIPYASAELALGDGRNSLNQTETGLTVGLGVGYKFQIQRINWDLSLNYSLLTSEVGNTAPSIFGLRLAVLF